MEQALQEVGISLKELEQNDIQLDGDFPQIWIDRPWHPLTRQEIYMLIWATKQLGFTLPELVLDRIAFWIQLIELCKDYRSGEIVLQLAGVLYADTPILSSCLGKWDRDGRLNHGQDGRLGHGGYYIRAGNILVDLVGYWEGDLERYNAEHRKEILEWKPYSLRAEAIYVTHFLARKDRYRIVLPNRQELWEFIIQLYERAAPRPKLKSWSTVEDDFVLK
jgi:hypothetical protein